MDDSTARLSPEAAFQLCERYREWFPELATNRERQAAEKCAVEFVF